MKLAPIVLFVYNRPEHTEKTLEALARNTLAKDSKLFVFSDGPKYLANNDEREKLRANIDKTREIVKGCKGFKQLIIEECSSNRGLQRSIIEGVTKIIEEYGKVIVLEDDLITSPYFLKFINEALDYYEASQNIFSVTGYVYPHKSINSYKYDTLLYPRCSTYGWGTWKDRWSKADWEVGGYYTFLKDKKLQKRFNSGGDDLTDMLKHQMNGLVKSWGIRWCYSQFINEAYSIFPTESLIKNIGFDGSGENCGAKEKEEGEINVDKSTFIFAPADYITTPLIRNVKSFFKAKKRPWPVSIVYYILRFLYRKLFKHDSYLQLQRRYKNRKPLTLCEVKYLGMKFTVPDVPDFLQQVKDFLHNEIYYFKTDSPQPIILDCNAKTGISTVYFKRKYPESTIKVYEADKTSFLFIEENIRKNNIDNGVNVINKAVGIDDKREGESIPPVCLPKEIEKLSEVELLRVAIEDRNLSLIEDCKDVLSKVKNIFIEYHSQRDREQKLDEILNILNDNGFRYYIKPISVKENAFNNKTKIGDMDFKVNIFAVKLNTYL